MSILILVGINSCTKGESDDPEDENNYETISDIEGNEYKIVTIGTQTWMGENLRTSKYNDGSDIPFVPEAEDWVILNTPGYCIYPNPPPPSSIVCGINYGKLYNWFTVSTGKLCPTGWHVPTYQEWTTLITYLINNGYNYDYTEDGNKIAMAMADSIKWWLSSSKVGAVGYNDLLERRNTTGFAARPGGYRAASATYWKRKEDGRWWASTAFNASDGWYVWMWFDSYGVTRINDDKRHAFYVRCLKD